MFFIFILYRPQILFYRPRFQPWGTYYSQRLKPLAMGLTYIPNYNQRLKPFFMFFIFIFHRPQIFFIAHGFNRGELIIPNG